MGEREQLRESERERERDSFQMNLVRICVGPWRGVFFQPLSGSNVLALDARFRGAGASQRVISKGLRNEGEAPRK